MRKVKLARNLGIPTKRLGGWEPKETTTVVEWDAEGRPSRWITEREPEWGRKETTLMLALDYLESTSCGRCGGSLTDTTDPANDPDNPDSARMYVADVPIECHHCKVLIRSERQWQEGLQHPEDGAAAIHTARLVDRPKRRERSRRGEVLRA